MLHPGSVSPCVQLLKSVLLLAGLVLLCSSPPALNAQAPRSRTRKKRQKQWSPPSGLAADRGEELRKARAPLLPELETATRASGPHSTAPGSGLWALLGARSSAPVLALASKAPILCLWQSHVHVDTVNFQPPVPSPRGTGLTSCISRIFAGAGGSVQTMLVS